MSYQFDFSSVLPYSGMIAEGLGRTLVLTIVGTIFGLALGIFAGACRAWKVQPLSTIFRVYIELIRNTPFLVQLFFIFFGLPAIGVTMNAWTASILAMIINLGAYSAEIVRAGIQATAKGQIEAAESLAMTRFQVLRYVVLPPSLGRVWPALCSQIIIVMLGSSVCSQISMEDLTFAANFIQSRNFRSFEIYIVIAVLYLILSVVIRALLLRLGRICFKGSDRV
ncbi:amino acid ABC transporter permease [Acinetobacter boissieri]|uniref:Amino acid ABC transporter membrane protein 1, PAAT family n=1 Tax=Acinetobacter boissieri TaxID=1219383 RepID=A0A1G6GKV4_9GAMM|nr:amino acid ABC transporter permease [Acinetobacter boissieri]SDB82641.1 amino acid ABC transporter membrane protein 1, PAAT family [Acinetobacter boissieri]